MSSNLIYRAFLKFLRILIVFFTKLDRKKIILIVESHSGSNTLALSKLFSLKVKENFKIEVLYDNTNTNIIDYIKKYHKIAKSKYIFTTHASYKPSKNHIHFQLWHGAFLKKNGIMLTQKNQNYIEKQKSWHRADYVLSYSETYTTFMNACMCINPNKYLIFGAPRNDFFFLENSRNKLSKILNYDIKEKKIILYMPTFNEEKNSIFLENDNIFSFNKWDINQFQSFLKTNNYILLIKSHPFYSNINITKGLKDNILFINESNLQKANIDLYEIMNSVSLLITDISSIFYDFLLLNKPILFISTSLQNHISNRGLLIESYEDYVPGPKISNQESLFVELEKLLNNPNYFSFERNYMKMFMHRFKDGNSTKRISNFLLEIANIK
jgi:CDP-glycerol glycerophosphotransferase (TagB/SpsB family)